MTSSGNEFLIIVTTFESQASIPDRLNDFYEQVFATLFNIHDVTHHLQSEANAVSYIIDLK